jgi:hypothetical protein
MAKKKNGDEDDSAFTDVSKDVETVQKDADTPSERDDDGKLVVDDKVSEANAKIADEQAVRASASANGGGPWPPELLVERFVGGTPLARS